jgi:hypothetical protein
VGTDFFHYIFLVVTLTIIIMRDYSFGEKWRKQLSGHKIDVSGKPTYIDEIIKFFAVIGVLAFISGLLGQAYVASSVIKSPIHHCKHVASSLDELWNSRFHNPVGWNKPG